MHIRLYLHGAFKYLMKILQNLLFLKEKKKKAFICIFPFFAFYSIKWILISPNPLKCVLWMENKKIIIPEKHFKSVAIVTNIAR